MSKNKLYNQSYFVKRLLDAGFTVKRLNIHFEDNDSRKWMILVNDRNNPYQFNICITCFKYYENGELKFTFKFQGQKEADFIFKTMTMNTIISILNSTFRNSTDLVEANTNE